MFLRKIVRKKDGKTHGYWALVESRRTSRGPRQHIVSYLGEMDGAGRLGLKLAAEQQESYQASLFDDTTPEWVEVDVRRVTVERSRDFGDIWLALELLRRLGLLEFFQQVLPSGREKISWAELASILVVARFCDPKSELYIAEHFYQRTALADLLGIPASEVYDNRLYRALDKILPHKPALEKHLYQRWGQLFNVSYDILLYDVTSTYFEGLASKNSQAQRGYSRDHRPDCKQICIALVVTKEGIPLSYEIFNGNTHDATTVETIVQKIETYHGAADRVWVMDRGMASEENIAFLQEGQRRYIIGTPKSMLKRFEQQILAGDWQSVHNGLEVQLCTSPSGDHELFILCRSAARRQKEEAIHQRFIERLEQGLVKLHRSCETGRVKNLGTLERRIGRLLEKNSRAAALFDIHASEDTTTHHLHLQWTIRHERKTWAQLSEGCYLLRTNIRDWCGEDLWRAYIQLTEVEAAFRIHKSDLQLRPIWHQKPERMQAHILVCFMAYVLWKCLATLCEHAGLGHEPRKVIDEIRQLKLVDVILPSRQGQKIRLQCVSKPEPALQILLQRLHLTPPQRFKQNHIL